MGQPSYRSPAALSKTVSTRPFTLLPHTVFRNQHLPQSQGLIAPNSPPTFQVVSFFLLCTLSVLMLEATLHLLLDVNGRSSKNENRPPTASKTQPISRIASVINPASTRPLTRSTHKNIDSNDFGSITIIRNTPIDNPQPLDLL